MTLAKVTTKRASVIHDPVLKQETGEDFRYSKTWKKIKRKQIIDPFFEFQSDEEADIRDQEIKELWESNVTRQRRDKANEK